MTESLSRSAARGVFFLGSSKAVNTVMRIGVLAVMARLLAPREFGIVAAALLVSGIGEVVLLRGLVPALIQRPVLESRHLQSMFVASLLLGGAGAGLLFLLAPLAAAAFDINEVEPILRVLSLAFLLNGSGVVSNALLRRDLAFGYLARAEAISYAIGYGALGIATAAAGWGVWALVVANLGQRAVWVSMLVIKRPPPYPRSFEMAALADIFPLAFGFGLGSVGGYVAQSADNTVVAVALGPVSLGVYGRAYQLMAEPVNKLGQVLSDVLFPAMSKVQDDSKRLGNGFIGGSRVVALVILPASLVLSMLGDEVVGALLGDQWTAAVTPFRILALGMVFRASFRMSETVARATGAVYRRAWRNWLYAGMVAVAALVGKQWGLNGVAAGVLFAMVANFVLMTGLALRLVEVPWSRFLRAYVPVVNLSILAVAVAWPMAEVLRSVNAPDVATLGGACAVAAVMALIAAWRFPRAFSVPDVARLVRMVKPG